MVSALETEVVSKANCDVAGGVFVEEDLFKDLAALEDGGVHTHKGYFTQASSTLVAIDVFGEGFFTLICMEVNKLALLEFKC